MSTNGNIDIDDDRDRVQRVLAGAATADAVIVPLDRAADALREVSRAFEGISLRLAKIGSDTARAISDTVQMKRYLKMFGEREEKLRAELDALKAQDDRNKKLWAEVNALKAQMTKRAGKKARKKLGKFEKKLRVKP
jgi:DNA repair ATPase RecN